MDTLTVEKTSEMNPYSLIAVVVFCSIVLCAGLVYAKRTSKAQEVIMASDPLASDPLYEEPMNVISRRNVVIDDTYETPSRLYDIACSRAIPEEISCEHSHDDSMTDRTLESYVTCEP